MGSKLTKGLMALTLLALPSESASIDGLVLAPSSVESTNVVRFNDAPTINGGLPEYELTEGGVHFYDVPTIVGEVPEYTMHQLIILTPDTPIIGGVPNVERTEGGYRFNDGSVVFSGETDLQVNILSFRKSPVIVGELPEFEQRGSKVVFYDVPTIVGEVPEFNFWRRYEFE